MNSVERGNRKRVERRAYQCAWLASHSKHVKYEAADGERKEKKKKNPHKHSPHEGCARHILRSDRLLLVRIARPYRIPMFFTLQIALAATADNPA